jgi:hypothetical protein
MLVSNATSSDSVVSAMSKNEGSGDKVSAGGVFTVQCHDSAGVLKWEASKHNLVVNVGLQDMNAKYFTGSGYTATWYIGLYGAAASNDPASTDTMASHAGWTEVTAYSQTTRPACTFGVPTTADPSIATNAASPATYNINGAVTIGGAFLTNDNTKNGTTGTLFSAADFQAPGDRVVVSGDTLTVTYTFSLDAV